MLSVEEIWKKYDATEARLSAPLSQRMLELARLSRGMHVLDLATGRGEPAIGACAQVAPTGRVIGVDIAASMLAMASERAIQENISNLELIVSDAQTLAGLPELTFDAVLARWGLMYMQDPVAALRAAHDRCRREASLVAALWAEPERVDYYTLPRSLLQKYKALPPIDFEVPGTFRLSSLSNIERDFQAAGWAVDLVEELYVDVMEANDHRELIDWCRHFGLNRLLHDVPLDLQQQWEQDLSEAGQARRNAQGVIRLGGVTRLVRCSRK